MVILMIPLLFPIPSFKYVVRVFIRIFYKGPRVFKKKYINLTFINIKPTGTSLEREGDEVCVSP